MGARNATRSSRRPAAWLTLGVLLLVQWLAIAGPWLAPATYTALCTGDGQARLVAIDPTGQPLDGSEHDLRCPLCLPATAPGPDTGTRSAFRPVARATALLPASGPPHFTARGGPPPSRAPPQRA